jgi:hypothetical protein
VGMVRSEDVAQSNRFNALRFPTCQMIALSLKGNFQMRPHLRKAK